MSSFRLCSNKKYVTTIVHGFISIYKIFFTIFIIGFFVFGGIGAGTVLCCKNRCLYLSAKELVYQDFTGKKKKIAYKNISSILSVLDGVCIFEQDCVKEHRINLSRQGKEQLRNYLEGKRFGFLIR